MNFLKNARQFLNEVRMEIRRINWLSRSDVFRYTIMVVFFSLIAALYLGAVDFVVQWVIGKYVV